MGLLPIVFFPHHWRPFEGPKGQLWPRPPSHDGRREAKKVGTREAAERVKRQFKARLALGDFGFLEEREKPTFAEYAERWLKHYVRVECKQSTQESYRRNLRIHVLPVFGSTRLTEITPRRS